MGVLCVLIGLGPYALSYRIFNRGDVGNGIATAVLGSVFFFGGLAILLYFKETRLDKGDIVQNSRSLFGKKTKRHRFGDVSKVKLVSRAAKSGNTVKSYFYLGLDLNSGEHLDLKSYDSKDQSVEQAELLSELLGVDVEKEGSRFRT